MISKEDFLSILSEYSDEKDMSRFKDMLGKSKQDFLKDYSKKLDVVDEPQLINANVILNSKSLYSEKYPICIIDVSNPFKKVCDFKIKITIDKGNIYSCSIKITDEIKKQYTITAERFKDLCVEDFLNKQLDCELSVHDQFDRSLCSTFGQLLFSNKEQDIQIKAEFDKGFKQTNENNTTKIANLLIESGETINISCTCNILKGNTEIVKQTISVPPKTNINHVIDLSKNVLDEIIGNNITINFQCSNKILASTQVQITNPDKTIKVPDEPNPAPSTVPSISFSPSKKKMAAEYSVEKMIDVNVIENGKIHLGRIVIKNLEPRSENVMYAVFLNSYELDSNQLTVNSKTSNCVELYASPERIRKEHTYSAEIKYMLLDEERKTILSRSDTVNIRSKYDLNLYELNQRTAEFVNPHSKSIKDFVDDGNGPLAKAMGSSYAVEGYQNPRFIIPQLEAVWRAVVNHKMSYVSDTSTIKDKNVYQRVRTPSKVLEDHSGNCIEFSILFASIFECMNFEPVIVFPQGHAIVGVLMKTNIYRSRAKYPDRLTDKMIRLVRSDGSKADVLFIESTMCGNKKIDFSTAVSSAHDTIMSELTSINANESYCLITQYRQNGINPILE